MKEFQLRTSYGSEVRCCLEIIPRLHHIQVYAWDEENGWEPWATATVQIGGLNENEVAIKNYSENEGILEALGSETDSMESSFAYSLFKNSRTY